MNASSGEAHRRRAESFDRVADDYDRARPAYPPELFDDLVTLTALPPGGRVLEIGCGSGVSTVPLAARGYEILCVEMGRDLAQVAARNLATYPRAKVVAARFEDWPAPLAPYDLVMAATAFHWLDPAVAYPKVAAALKPGGCLGVFWNRHVAAEPDGFFHRVQPIYERYAPSLAGFTLPTASEVPSGLPRLPESGLFEVRHTRRYVWRVAYEADEYVRLLGTYSDHLALDEGARERLFRELHSFIVEGFGGRVEKQYLSVLVVAGRVR